MMNIPGGILLIFLAAAAPAALAVPPGAVLWLPFDEFRGDITPDTSGQGNDGVVLAGELTKGIDGTAVDFSAPGSGIWCDDTRSLHLTGALTLAAWFRPASRGTGNFGTVLRKEAAYALRFDGDRLGLLLWIGGKVSSLHTPPLNLRPGTWMQVAGIWDGKLMRLVIDGKEVAVSSEPVSGPLDASGAPLGVGSCRGRYRLDGALDEVLVWDRALTVQELAGMYAAGRRCEAEQRGRRVTPRRLGRQMMVFRKPAGEIPMIVPGFLWIDAEDFQQYGGWLLDTQFVHLMGSAYLMAAGVGHPVADATTEIELPRAGRYVVWVRSRNWVVDYAPGQFMLRIDDKPMPKILGKAPTPAWCWERAGERDLEAGRHRLALRDMTGYYGRCDAIVLTTDREYKPPAGRDELCRERARLRGFSLEPTPGGDFDVIVVGAGSAGCPAALAAARLGARTALIQNRPVLGGNASKECGVPLNGASSHHPNARETGIAEEVGRLRARYAFGSYSEPFAMLAAKEPKLTVVLNRHVFAVEMASARRIAAVRAVDTLTGMISRYRAKMFIDCTGDGWVGYFAGAEYRLGREARSEFGESLAPEKPDSLTMSGCLMGGALGFRARDIGRPAPFVRPPWAREITHIEGFGRHVRRISGGEWWMEHPNDVDDLWHAEEARDELIKIAFSYWDYIKNKSELRDKAATYVLDRIPIMDAKRESRRLVGDVILTQNDCEQGRVFPDRISYGGWPMDVHHPKGIFSGKEGSFYCNKQVPIYTIPFRCLYSKNIENLLFAGRCVSVTHIALGTVRVQSTLATLGQAAGTAAAMCVSLKTTPRGIYEHHIGELQQTLLRYDQTIPGIVNEDPRDLALRAKASASSTAAFVPFERVTVNRETVHPLNMERGMMFPAAGLGRLRQVELYLGNDKAAPVDVVLHLRGSRRSGDWSSDRDVARVRASVPPGKGSWVRFPLDATVDTPFVWFYLEAADGVTWYLMHSVPEGSMRFYGRAADHSWTPREGESYAFKTVPPLRIPARFAPAYAINGRARMGEGKTNMWASDPSQPLPQWLQLDLPTVEEINTVILTFDTNLSHRLSGVGKPPECVRDYRIDVRNADGTWHEAASVTGNFQRHNTVRFDPVRTNGVRVTVLATNGDPSARIFEVRIYRD